MARYRFQPDRPPAEEIRRVALDQLECAVTEINDENLDDVKRIHAVRKRFKKLRSLFRLMRKADRRFARGEDRRYREMGRILSSRRDADVMLSTIDALSTKPDKLSRDYPAVRKRLSGAHDSANDRDSLDQIEQRLHEAREAMLSWSPPEISQSEVFDEFVAQYRRGREAYQSAKRKTSSDIMHEWRKRTKDHWYQLRLLRDFQSELFSQRIKRLRKLALLLGEDHDLAVLSDRCGRKPKSKRERRELAAMRKRIVRRRKRLGKRCLQLGRQIFKKKPGSVRRYMTHDPAPAAVPDVTNEIAGLFEVVASGQHFS